MIMQSPTSVVVEGECDAPLGRGQGQKEARREKQQEENAKPEQGLVS